MPCEHCPAGGDESRCGSCRHSRQLDDSTVDLGDTPGCVLDLPTEPLDETPEYKALRRKDTLLTLVANWYGSYLMGRPTAVDHAAKPSDCLSLMKRLKVRAELLIDLVEADGDSTRLTTTPATTPASAAAVMVNGGPHTSDAEQAEPGNHDAA